MPNLEPKAGKPDSKSGKPNYTDNTHGDKDKTVGPTLLHKIALNIF